MVEHKSPMFRHQSDELIEQYYLQTKYHKTYSRDLINNTIFVWLFHMRSKFDL